MDDFEELKEGESVIVHLLAGALAGTAEHIGMYPIDTIKTNMQAYTSETHHSMNHTWERIVSRSGFRGLFSGITAVAAGAAPAHALQYATYEFCKNKFGGNAEGHHPFKTGAAGVCATIVSDAVLTPMDAVKQKMQLGIVQYKSMTDCIQKVMRTEGLGALYAGYTTTLLMNIPYHAIYFGSYESLRRLFKKGPESEFDLGAHLLAGGGAGSIAAAVTNPFDVAKTRLQTQSDVGRKYGGMVNTLTTIWKEEGKAGFMRGMKPRIAFNSLSAAICWISYEYGKNVLNKIFPPSVPSP
eukprot:TRINITY_DN2074_c0_g1_i1.p1 TRINITY_DN2074_c0_g1~~TRINITY_DN2074_c0_g1_i1.p1  ORF type:complete len:297 (+),score=53.14 TRINITY_DN2074_c0_g1_i1:195-1085(+)